MLASIGPLVFACFGAIASGVLGMRAKEEMIKVAAVGAAALCAILCLVFAPLFLKATLVIVPSVAALLSNGGDGG